MSEPRVRRLEARPATPDVDEYRALVGLSGLPAPETAEGVARELVRLCRFRGRPALLRSNLRFGRELRLIRVADLDGDGHNEMLVIDADRTVHTPRRLRDSSDTEGAGTWMIGNHRFRGRLLGVSFSSFGVFNRKEAIVTSLDEQPSGAVYRELKLTCDGQSWDVSELEHRQGLLSSQHIGGGEIRLIGDSSELGRMPVLRARPEDGRLWVEILDDRAGRPASEHPDFSRVSFLQGEVTDLALCEDELIVAYARGGLQRISRDGRQSKLVLPEWRFVCLAYAPKRLLDGKTATGGGLLLGGTSFGYVFALDMLYGGVKWRMDAGFLFSAMTLADAENTGRIDLVLGGIDGSMRIYELTDLARIDQRCRRLYGLLGEQAAERLYQLAPAMQDGHAPVQLYLLARILESTGPAGQAVVDLVRWFTPGQPGWHTLPERAQREAVVTMEHFLLAHLPKLARDELRATRTGPLPLLTVAQAMAQVGSSSDVLRPVTPDPDTHLQLARTILAELVDIYLSAPRLVRHQIDRISRRLLEQYLVHVPETGIDESMVADSPPPELKRLLGVRSLRAREYAHFLMVEAAQRLQHLDTRPEQAPSASSEELDAVVLRVLRAMGLVEELRWDRFSVETERLDFAATAIDCLRVGPAGERECVVGIDRSDELRVEALDLPSRSDAAGTKKAANSSADSSGGSMPSAQSPSSEGWPWQRVPQGRGARIPRRGQVRFVEVRRLWEEGGRTRPAVVVGVEESNDTWVSIYVADEHGTLTLRAEARCGGTGAESIGMEHVGLAGPDGQGPRESLVLRVPATSERGRALVLSMSVVDGQVRAQALPSDLLAVVSSAGGCAQLTGARVSLHCPGRSTLTVPVSVGACCAALSADGNKLAVGTTSGLVQLFAADDESLRLVGQYLFSKGISTLAFLPDGVFGGGAMAIGTEDEQIHAIATDHLRDGLELVRLAVGGTPIRLQCLAITSESGEQGYRMLILLSGGTLASWEAHPQDGHGDLLDRLMELGSKAAGSRANLLRAALRGQGPHIRAVAVRELFKLAKEGRIAGSILSAGLTTHASRPASSSAHRVTPRISIPQQPTRPSGSAAGGAPSTASASSSGLRVQTERGTPASASILHLSKLFCSPEAPVDGSQPRLTPPLGLMTPTATGRGEVYDLSTWPLPRQPRHRLVICQILEALVPIALGGTGSGADMQQSRVGRELIGKLVGLCDEPLTIRGDLLQIIEQWVRPEHVEDLVSWLPTLILHDSRSAAWAFATDSAATLFLRHLQRMDRARVFDLAEPLFFRNMVAILEAVAQTPPSRFLLTNMGLLLRSALSWDRVFLAGDLGRTRMHLPHAAIEAMAQPEILPDAEARAFLLSVSRRWGPRLPSRSAEEFEDILSETGAASESELYWRFEAALDNGFDRGYYERLSEELGRNPMTQAGDGTAPDAWALIEVVRGMLRLFDISNLGELQASLQPGAIDKALSPLRAQRALSSKQLAYRYRDEAWGFFDESCFDAEKEFLQQALQEVDRKTHKAQIAHSLDEVASRIDQRRTTLRQRVLEQLTGGPPLSHPSAFVSRMLEVRPKASVVTLLSVWWQVLVEEAMRLRTEPDFEVRLVSDLGVADGRRVHRHAVILATDAARTAHGVMMSVRSTDPKEVRARGTEGEAIDLEPGQELGLLVDCPASIAAEGVRYRVEIELSHDGDKRTLRMVEGQFRREQRQQARTLFDSMSERLPTLFQARRDQLLELVKPPLSTVALVTAFPAHAYELLAEAIGLDWPDRPIDTLEHWRMVNVAARGGPPGSGGAATSTGLAASRTAQPHLRDVVHQLAQRLSSVLSLPTAERLDTSETLLRAVAESPQAATSTRGLILLGLPELAERGRLDDADQRHLLQLGVQICLSYRGRALILLSPQAAALSLGITASGSAAWGGTSTEGGSRHLELLDLDHVADPYSLHRADERMRSELEQALSLQLQAREASGTVPVANPALGTSGGSLSQTSAQAGVRLLIDATGTDLRLIAECMPTIEQGLRDRVRTPLSTSLFETRVGTYLAPVYSALPLPHKLYLAALSCDAIELDVSELRPGMVVDAPVYSISGKDRQPTSKVIAAAGLRLDQRTIDDLVKVMWLKKVRVRGSLQDGRTVLWTYLKQVRPRTKSRVVDETARSGERWLEATASDLRRLGLVRAVRISGERWFTAFTSTAVRDWLRSLLGVSDGETGLPNTIDGRNLVRQLPLWDAAAVDRTLGGNSAQLRAVLGWNRPGVQGLQNRWQDFLDLSRACRKWMDGQDDRRFLESLGKYFRVDLVDGTEVALEHAGEVPMRSVQVRFREKKQIPWLKRVVIYLPAAQPDRAMLDQVLNDLRARLPVMSSGSSGPIMAQRDSGQAIGGMDGAINDTSLSAIVAVPELTPEILSWSRNLFHVAAIDVADLQHAALHDHPVEELIRRLAAAASYAALSPFRSKMGLANQELIEEMFYGRRALLEEIRGQRQENFLIVGPRKIGKTSLLQRVRYELERQGYRVVPQGMDYTTAPSSRELLMAMIRELLADIDPMRAVPEFALGEELPPLRAIVEQWAKRHPERSLAIVLDECDTILRTERRNYLLGEWREATVLGQALASLLPAGKGEITEAQVAAVRELLRGGGWPSDVVEGVAEGLQTPPEDRRPSVLLEELRSVAALLLQGGAVCRVILAGHAEMVEARWDLFGPLLNFAKLRMLGPLDEGSAERMVREPFARLGLRFESATAENLLFEKTFRVPAWIQHCGALIIQSIDERLRVARREEQKITERDVLLALEKVHAEERAGLQSENGMYMLGPECSFVLLSLVEEGWFSVDDAVDFLHVFYQTLDEPERRKICSQDEDYVVAFGPEPVRRMVRDLTNTFYLYSDEAEYLTTEGRISTSAPNLHAVSLEALSAGMPGDPGRDRLRKSYRVNRSMVATVFADELLVTKRIDLARRAMRLWHSGRGVWARSVSK